jgi:CyaY protein
MTTEALTERAFEDAAEEALASLEEALSDLDGLEVTLSMGILTLEFEDGAKYVVNSHRAARQIWMAAELRAWHFDFHPEAKRWIASKDGDELRATLAAVVGKKLGRAIALA